LTQAQVRALSQPVGRPMGAEDIRHLQGTKAHIKTYFGASVSSGLMTSLSTSVATWV
jgi:hypothetical protein